jgi:hypothetical protein
MIVAPMFAGPTPPRAGMASRLLGLPAQDGNIA